MKEKIKNYERLILSKAYKELPFQQVNREVMPVILVVGGGVPYSITSNYVRIVQTQSIEEFMTKMGEKTQAVKIEKNGVIIKMG